MSKRNIKSLEDFLYSVNLGKAQDKERFIANYVNKNYGDQISKRIINNLPSGRVLDEIEWDYIFHQMKVYEFINRYGYILRNRIYTLSEIKDKDIVDQLRVFFLSNIRTDLKVYTDIIIDDGLRDVKNKGLNPDSWYYLYHPKIGILNHHNIEQFEDLIDSYLWHWPKLTFKFILKTKNEFDILFDKLCPYSNVELNMLELRNPKNDRNIDIIIDAYEVYIEKVAVSNILNIKDLIYDSYMRGVKSYGH